MKTACLIVTWNSASLLDRSVGGACRIFGDKNVYVIDNGSSDGTCDALRARYPHVSLFSLPLNTGFAAGNNYGLRAVMRSPYDAVCLLNADTIVTGDFLTPCTAVLAERGDVGIIGPTVLEARTPDIIQCEGGEIVRWRLGFNYLRAGEVYTIKEDVVDVGYVLGAAMIIRREIIETVGAFDEDYTPAYVEEADLCYRARLAGYRCVVHRGASIQHIGGSSAAGKSKTYTRVALRRLYFGTKFLPWPVFMVAGSYVLLQLVLAKLRAAGSSEANGPASIRTDV